MPRGYPDWGRIRKEAGIVAIGDLGELAVRLGSPTIFDRRGDVFFIDTFENGLMRWDWGVDGLGAGVTLSVEYAQHGGYSVKLIGGSDEDRYALINTQLQALWPGRWGLECACAYDTSTDKVIWTFEYGDGENTYYFKIRNDRVDQTLEYFKEGAQWIVFATDVWPFIGPFAWYNFKLVIDTDTKEYVRFLAAADEWDISQVVPHFVPMTGIPYFWVEIEVISEVGMNGTLFVDSVIVSFNEP